MLTHDELAAIIVAEWPALAPHRDFWTAHAVAGATQTSPAFIAAWLPIDIPEPDEAGIEALAIKHAGVIEAMRRPPVPASITRRQCAIEMRARELISDDEMVAMVKAGDLPSIVSGMTAAMAPEQKARVEVDFAASTYARDNPLLNALMGALPGGDADGIDAFFIAAARH